ncbi:MAG: phosphate ABC transporter permease subunit PstC [Rhodospirillaceae bacterium]|nr:MAG: phosphate ABC transporter permease subunit PstC [Rhodospirillaceae bacterium]
MLNLWIRGATATVFLAVLGMLVFLLDAAWPSFQAHSPGALFSSEWYPYEGLFGLLPAVIGSAWSVLIALALAVPTGLAAAILTTEILEGIWFRVLRVGMEMLAGIPSIVYGLIGLHVLLPWLELTFDLLTGHSLLAAGLLLFVMILPTIMVLSQDALIKVAATQREAGLSLGMDWTERLCFVLLPQAWPGIRSGILLALGRALGETMAVMLVVGSMDRIPDPWYRLLAPAQTLTSRIGREIGEAPFGSIHFSALMACGLVLAMLTIGLSLMAHARIRKAA